MTGSISNISFYTRKGSDKVIARTKGGASKEKIKSSAKFEGFRLQQNEWRGCTRFASILRYAFGGLHRVADYNLTPVLNAFAKELQKTDTESINGQRGIYLSKYRHTLDGFNFNHTYPFNTVLRNGVVGEIHRETLSATVRVPRINTDVDVLNVLNLPYFRLVVALGAVSDLQSYVEGKQYEPLVADIHGVSQTVTGEWVAAENVLPEQIIKVELGDEFLPYLTDNVSMVLSMAIEFGKVGFTGAPQEIKNAGNGKVLKVG